MIRMWKSLRRLMDSSLTEMVIGTISGIGPITPPTENGRSWKMRPTVLIGAPIFVESWYDGKTSMT